MKMNNKITEIAQLNLSLEEIAQTLGTTVEKLQGLKINTIIDILNAYWAMQDAKSYYQMMVGNLL